jgi:UDP-N-acetylglucosamine 4,6-dehydratase/5-epimerase
MKMEQLEKIYKDKVILVTGGTGTIGSEIVRKLLEYPVRQIRIFSRGEFKQYSLNREFSSLPKGKVNFLIGDIRDRERVFMAMEGVDIVFNVAAMKHVPLCESNPFEAIKTNVVGTQNLVEAARAYNVERFVHVSTDKAAMPVNVMGATKLLAEKLVTSAKNYKGQHNTVFSAVRFGNVFGSRGSVVPLFYEQIKKGGPVTLTNSEMTRFVMLISQAAELVIKSAAIARGGELFILKMPVLKIGDVAKAMIALLAPKFGLKPEKVKIEVIGRREGEKIYELLLVDEEAENLHENDEMFCIAAQPPKGFKPAGVTTYRSDKTAVKMSYKEVSAFIENVLANSKEMRYVEL